MLLRSRDVEQWMRHRRLPEDLKRYEIKCSNSSDESHMNCELVYLSISASQ